MTAAFPTTIDAIVMLTWSDWQTEPRSNRYHYAVRFARHRPVYFVQPDGDGEAVSFEPVDGHDITIVHIAPDYGPSQSARLAKALRQRGVGRPLVWMYNVFFASAVRRLHPALVAFHATEDYLAPADTVQITQANLSADVKAALAQTDLVVAVSVGVADSYRRAAPRDTEIMVLPNGCDFSFWEASGAAQHRPVEDGATVALFQGGINSRLDYTLLSKLALQLPDWQFWFCGKSTDGGEEWSRLQELANVRYLGFLGSEGIADLARQASVGLIPFKDSDLMRRSLPLKAYEYLACGLPVVTVPIDALAGKPGLFTFANTADDFAHALQSLAPTRTDPTCLRQRLEAAESTSYDARFEELLSEIAALLQRRAKLNPSLNILLLYDDRSTHVGTINEHLEAFRSYSRHRVHYMPATGSLQVDANDGSALDLSCYDALAIHYSVRVSIEEHLAPSVARAIAAYRGPKLLFIQDEYDRVETARRWIERLGIDAIYTNVPVDSLDIVYPRSRFPLVDFIPTLTGYVPEDPFMDEFVRPMAERHIRIAYRGRTLPHHYGALGQQKYRIGVDVRRLAEQRGVPIDIEVDESSRIYGLDWYRFIGSARATLGTESGANVFDMDGRLGELATSHKDMPFDAFARSFLQEHEGRVRMNQISPKIFESIRLRTALVLFEGTYSGVIEADKHYIPLKQDYSNIDDVLQKLEDIAYLEKLTERAFQDIIATGAYSYRRFVEGVDSYLSARAGGRRRATIVSTPLVAIYGPDDAMTPGVGPAAVGLLNDAILGPQLSRERMIDITTAIQQRSGSDETQPIVTDLSAPAFSSASRTRLALPPARWIWRRLPEASRSAILREIRALPSDAEGTISASGRLARLVWRSLPSTLREQIKARIR